MERLSTEYSLRDDETEGLVSHLRQKGFTVTRRDNRRDYELFRNIGSEKCPMLQSLGHIKNRCLMVGYLAEGLLKVVTEYMAISIAPKPSV